MSQCCCDCNCTPCCCNQPSAAHTYENGAVNDINAGNALRVSDRNGNPKDLVGEDYTVPNTYNGKVANRSGAEGDEVKLKLKELSGNAVAVVHVDGDSVTILGIVKPEDGDDSFLMQLNGEMKFKKHPTFTALFEENQIDESKTGKIALITCGPNGTLQLSKFSGCGEVKPLIVDEDGDVVCDSICEYIDEVEEGLDSIWGCEDGNWRKLTAENDKELIIEDGKFKLGDKIAALTWLADPYMVASKAQNEANINVSGALEVFGTSGSASGTFAAGSGGVPETAKIVQVRTRLVISCDEAVTVSWAWLKINGILLQECKQEERENNISDTMIFEIPLDEDGEFNYELYTYCSAEGATGASAYIGLEILGYK